MNPASPRDSHAYREIELIRGEPRWYDYVQDLRHSVRLIRKRPVFAAAIVLSIALGVGANSAIFSVANVLLIRPLPFPDDDQLIRVRTSFSDPGKGLQGLHLSELGVATISSQSLAISR